MKMALNIYHCMLASSSPRCHDFDTADPTGLRSSQASPGVPIAPETWLCKQSLTGYEFDHFAG